MREDLSPLLQRAAAVIVRDVAGSLGERSGSVYKARGAAATTRLVEALVTALVADVATGAARTLRSILRDTLNELSEAAISFRDLRLLQEALRTDLFARIEVAGLPLAALRAVEDWFHELTHQCSLYLISQREVLIDRQASEIEVKLAEQRQLSIPIVPIHAGVLVAPLVGNLDAYRAQVLTARVLEVVGHSRARLLLLDVSGVAKIDQEVVDHLLRTTRAVRLLGCEVVLIGIAAEFARTIATLAVDYRDLTVRRSLQDGFAYALATMGLAIAAAR
ncbi:STAS domain-containing protein [Nannocystis radixulma]|uniref:STAS domain-containing protein n=1 Tax=Nannocystis radixulma TaxID=2995305 RepID=A0ABT5B8L9_9BACT|nr:STAS domain-containing protein [Nannocystis radixulma]MDC0669869.1 STAS domain-containing protein [Nannocystis radixulma]